MKLGLTRWIATGTGAGVLALVLAAGGLAQEATPVTDEGMAMTETGQPHPAHIHVGTCDNLDPSPLFPLADVVIPVAGAEGGAASPAAATPMASPVTDMATPVDGAGDTGGATGSAVPAGQSTTVVPAGLADILAADHAINVHLSYEQADVYIACGTIGGMADANGNLFIGLAELNDSGYSGVAWLHDNGDGTTTVTVFLSTGLGGDAMGAMAGGAGATPDATPAA